MKTQNYSLTLLIGAFFSTFGCSDHTSATPWQFHDPEEMHTNNHSEEPTLENNNPSVELSPFVGLWFVSQPYHAGYEATTYDFLATGELVEVENFDFGSGPVPVGRVARCEEFGGYCERWGEECVFADRWRSVGTTLYIYSECSDGVSREVELVFPEDLNTSFIDPIISVDGDLAWGHNSFQWAWQRCEESCECHLEGQC